jgi:hypothetical protein
MSLSRTAFALALLLAAVPVLHASPITYQMTFTSGSYTGAGTLTLASQPAGSGTTSDNLANRQLQQLTFSVGGHTFDFSADPSASVQFVNGQISKINFSQAAGQAPASYTVEFANGFSLYGSNLDSPLVTGSFNVTPSFVSENTGSEAATSPTPEPRSLYLVATALLGGGGFLIFRRVRQAHS